MGHPAHKDLNRLLLAEPIILVLAKNTDLPSNRCLLGVLTPTGQKQWRLIVMRKPVAEFMITAQLVMASLAVLAQQPAVSGQQQYADLGVCKLAGGGEI